MNKFSPLPIAGDPGQLEGRIPQAIAPSRDRLPDGPKGTWVPTLKLIRNPRAALEGWSKQYGDPFLMRALNGPVVVTGREDLLRAVHGQDPDVYETFATQTTGPLLGSGSMLILFGPPHRRERRMMTPMFHGDRMKSYGESMQRTALDQMQRYRNRQIVPCVQLMTDISLDVIIRTIFGSQNRNLADQMFMASKRLVACAHPLLFFSRRSHFRFLGITPWDRWLKAKGRLVTLLDQAIDAHDPDDSSRSDILAHLCRARYEDGSVMKREDIHAELMTFLFAGHETTALSLAWAIDHIHRSPQVLKKLSDELNGLTDESPERLLASTYLKAVIQETLRINPIITETLRKLREPMELGEYRLPAGMAIAPATILAHYHPDVFPDPDTFRPERFIDRSYSPFQYMPFGGGHRRCIGAAFATYEMTMVLGVLLRHFTFELVDTNPPVPKRRNITMGPSTDIPVRIRERR